MAVRGGAGRHRAAPGAASQDHCLRRDTPPQARHNDTIHESSRLKARSSVCKSHALSRNPAPFGASLVENLYGLVESSARLFSSNALQVLAPLLFSAGLVTASASMAFSTRVAAAAVVNWQRVLRGRQARRRALWPASPLTLAATGIRMIPQQGCLPKHPAPLPAQSPWRQKLKLRLQGSAKPPG